MGKTQKEIEAENRKNIIEKLNDNVFVEAGAGAGKTTLIVSRIVNQLKQGMAPDGIAVITFTNAAAEELRSRITRKVREAASQADLTEQERMYLKGALQQLDLMKISTIHSFCFTLLKERIFDAKLPMDARLIEEAEADEQKYRIFTEWASTLTDADWMRLTEGGDTKSKIMDWMRSFYMDICELSDDTDIYCDRTLFSTNFKPKAKSLVEDFTKRFCEEAGKLLGQTITDVSAIPESILIADAKEHFVDVLKKEDSYFEVLKFICSKSKTQKKYFKGGKAAAPDLACRNWYEIEHRTEVDCLIEQNVDSNYNLILDYALQARKYYRSVRPLRTVSNDDLLQKTHRLICESEEAREYFAGKISCLYVDEFQDTDHIQEEFIWKLCATKEDENQLRDGVLFLVGDPKQSIYRFRGAEPDVYFHAKEKMRKLSNAKVYSLDNNYRSNEAIISWVNDSFRTQKISKDAAYRDMVHNRALPDGKDEKLLTGVYYYNSPKLAGAKLENDAALLAEVIDTLAGEAKITDYDSTGKPYIRLVNYADFLVLCYSKNDMEVYLKEMQKLGIPVQINGAVSLENNQVISNFVRIFDALVHPYDKAKRVGALEALRESGAYNEEEILDNLLIEIKQMSLYGIAETVAGKWELLLPKNVMISGELMQSLQSKLWQMIENVFAADAMDNDSLAERFWSYRGIKLERELPLEENGQAVRFMNLHKAKGLEGNIVILAKRSEKIKFHGGAFRKGNMYYPALKDSHNRIIWNSYAHLSAVLKEAELEETEEQTRLQYVAATRAKQVFLVMDAISEECMFTAPAYDFDEGNVQKSITTLLEKLPAKAKAVPVVKTYTAASQRVEPVMTASGKRQDEALYGKYSPSELEEASATKQKVYAELDRTNLAKANRPKGNIFGTAMHRSLELLIERWRGDFTQTPEQLQEVMKVSVNQAIFEGRNDIKKSEICDYRDFLTEILNCFAKWAHQEGLFTNENVAEIYTEYGFSFAADDIEINGDCNEKWINGTADLLILGKNGHLRILDYKSDRDDNLTEEQFVISLKEKYHGQLELYKKAMARLFKLEEENIELGIFSFTEKDTDGELKIRYTQM